MNKIKYDFIEIGTSDFETEIQNCNEEFGLSIEPIDFYLNRLPNKKNVTKINAAVSNFNGFVDVYFLSEEVIESFKLPEYVKGQNSIGYPHPEILKSWSGKGLTVNHISKKKVEVINFEKIINQYNVGGLILLKIDTEGHDCVILEDYLEYTKDKKYLLAEKIIFESNILSDQNRVKSIINRFLSLNYKLIKTGENTILEKINC
jgi:hypothetical protein